MRALARTALPVLAAALLVLAAAAPAQAASNIVIVSLDSGTGLGFDDSTPRAPVGGNAGTTLGQQRLIAANFVASLWGAALDSDVTVFVLATFQPLSCTPTSGTLGSAGTTFIFSDFVAGGIFPNTWYHSALADAIAGVDLNPGFGDIITRYNGDIGVNPNCLTGLDWYYGLDNNAAPNQFDFVNVLGHELAHGLGFANFVNEATGANFAGQTDIYSQYTFDNTQGLIWSAMNDAQRATSAVNDGKVVWVGPAVTARAHKELGPRPQLVTSIGNFEVQTASFGPALTVGGTGGPIVRATDGVGNSFDGCEPLTNISTGDIALIDRGTCTFTAKVKNAQNAGAAGAVIANTSAGLPPMGGADPTITIPSVGISQADGNTIKAALPGVNGILQLNPAFLAGADNAGRVRLYAPPVVSLGSSLSHWDTVATPNLLMEPFITSTLKAATTFDLTPFQLRDVGWGVTVVIDGCDSGTPDVQLANGCTLSDAIADCAANATNHGGFVSCATHEANGFKKAGHISGAQKEAVVSCAAGSSIP